MTPYLTAYNLYHSAGEMDVSWTEAIDYHAQRGAIIATPYLFVMARPVSPDWPENWHSDISHAQAGTSRVWHIYAAAGDLHGLLCLAKSHGISHVTFHRRAKNKLHWLAIS